MKLHKKLIIAGAVLVVIGGGVFAANFAYMYELVGRCINADSACNPYDMWDVVNLISMIVAGVGLAAFVAGVALFFRHIDREDDKAQKDTP